MSARLAFTTGNDPLLPEGSLTTFAGPSTRNASIRRWLANALVAERIVASRPVVLISRDCCDWEERSSFLFKLGAVSLQRHQRGLIHELHPGRWFTDDDAEP